MNYHNLPALNALLNLTSAVLLTFGYVNIRRRNRTRHMRFMLAALGVSLLFLASYIVYHAKVGSVPYPLHDWTRTLYFILLIPHVILAAFVTPFIILIVIFAVRSRFDRHRRLARVVLPVWLFVSVSGVAVYLLNYHIAR